MGYYDLDKEERSAIARQIREELEQDTEAGKHNSFLKYFSDNDTYIRKTAYIAVGRIYNQHSHHRKIIIRLLDKQFKEPEFKARQTAINAAGEIGIYDFEEVRHFFDRGLFDAHHSVRNAVIGSMKKMGEKNPQPVIAWSRAYLHHPDKEIRREIIHGIELRGRKHPEDILPLLHELQYDKTKRVKWTLVHVIGQVSYKKGCLEKVIQDIKNWENKELITAAITEIIDVHHRYRNFAHYTQAQAKEYIEQEMQEW
jgi:HEAT repeat protein